MALVPFHPDTVVGEAGMQLLRYAGLDGHWFVTNLIGVLARGFINPGVSRLTLNEQIQCFQEEILPDYLVEWFLDSLPEEDNEGRVRALDDYLAEHEWELLLMARVVLDELLYCLSNVDMPAWMPRDNLLKYLAGIVVVDQFTSALYFDFS